MPASFCLCNNRGGVGKTFMAFQASAAVAVKNPQKKVLAVDFSIYSDLSALLLGGTASKTFNDPSVGLERAKEKIPPQSRVDGLLRSLYEPRVQRKGIFGGLFNRTAHDSVDLTNFAVRVADHNPQAPPNLYLIASAGRDTYDDKTAHFFGGDLAAHEKTAEAGRVLRRAVDALSEDFCTVVFDTDHLAGSHLTRLALAAAETCVVPCPTDTGEFHRLFQTPDSSQFEGVE